MRVQTALGIINSIQLFSANSKLAKMQSDLAYQAQQAFAQDQRQTQIEQVRQLIFDARVQWEEIENIAAADPIQAYVFSRSASGLLQDISPQMLPEIGDKEYLYKVNKYAGDINASIEDTLGQEALNIIDRSEELRGVIQRISYMIFLVSSLEHVRPSFFGGTKKLNKKGLNKIHHLANEYDIIELMPDGQTLIEKYQNNQVKRSALTGEIKRHAKLMKDNDMGFIDQYMFANPRNELHLKKDIHGLDPMLEEAKSEQATIMNDLLPSALYIEETSFSNA